MKKGILIGLFALCMATTPSPVFAGDIWEMAESEGYGQKAGGMFARGLLNAASCFVDLVVHTVEGTEQGPPVVGTLGGIGTGAACTVLRAGSGVMDVATFWIPGFNGIPVSRSYSNCLESEGQPSPFGRMQSSSTSPYVAPTQARAPVYVAPAGAPVQSSVSQVSYKAPTAAKAPAFQQAAPAHDPTAYVKGGGPADSVAGHDPAMYVKK